MDTFFTQGVDKAKWFCKAIDKFKLKFLEIKLLLIVTENHKKYAGLKSPFRNTSIKTSFARIITCTLNVKLSVNQKINN